MTAALRKLGLTLHVSTSVGWFGAVAAFLALSLTSLASTDPEVVHAADVAMAMTARSAVVPFAFLSLITGVVQSLATPWGLFRHHWVIAKLFITALSTLLLMVHLRPIALLSTSRTAQAMSVDLHAVRVQVSVDASLALVALLLATALGVFKPKGTARFGSRRALAKTT